MHEKECGGGSMLLSFLLGGVVGAAAALLFAPMTGRETRRRIADYAEDVKDKAEELYKDTKEKAGYAYQKGKDYVDDRKSMISSAIEAGKEAYEKEKEKHSK